MRVYIVVHNHKKRTTIVSVYLNKPAAKKEVERLDKKHGGPKDWYNLEKFDVMDALDFDDPKENQETKAQEPESSP